MKISSYTSGSWFPTGFYGHDRMRNRADFINEYRQLAKPQPPDAFIQRSSQPVTSHVFSRHDNKHLFQRDVTSFGQGLGKKKHPERSENSKSNMAWASFRANHSSGYPLTSTYRQDFKMQEPHVQMLIKRPHSSFDGATPTTIYRAVHCTDSPNCHLIDAMNNQSLMLSLRGRQNHAVMKQKDHQESVASCMSWYKPILPPVVGHPDFNHIGIQPVQNSEMKCCNFLKSTCSSAASANQDVKSDHTVQNISE